VLDADVAVVGAGPAGTAAAIHAARRGLRVALFDRARFPRDKCCGDGLTTLALRELEDLGFDPATVASWVDVHEAVLRAPSGREVHLPLPPPSQGRFAAVAARRDLDAALVDLARAAGVEVHEGAALADADGAAADHIALHVEGHGTVRAAYAIGADGMWSPLRRALGADHPGYRGEWHAFRQYVRTSEPTARQLWVWFDADLLPGYAWSFPLPDGRANVGFGVLRGGRWRVREMAALWRDVLARPHVRAVLGPDAELEETHRAWPIPARVDEVVLTRGRALFVGDAAAAADVLTGEGIGQALLTGRLAAEAVHAAGPQRADAARAGYERAVRAALHADHRLSAGLGRLLQGRRTTDAVLALVDASGWTRANFARWMFEDEPRAVLATPRRWHRHLLRRPGPRLAPAAGRSEASPPGHAPVTAAP